MLRILKAELFKLKKNTTFKVLCLIMLFLSFFSIGMTKLMSSEGFIDSITKEMSESEKQAFEQQMQSVSEQDTEIRLSSNMGMTISGEDPFHPTGKEVFYQSFGNGIIEIFIAVLVGAMVAKEYSKGTIKNTLAYGVKRYKYYIGKVLAISIGVIVLLAILVSVSTVGICIFEGWGETFDFGEVLGILKVFGSASLATIAVTSLMVLLATVLKSNGSTIGIGIVLFSVVPMFLGIIYGIYGWLDNILKLIPAYTWATVVSPIATNGDLLRAVLVSVVTSVIATLLGICVINRQDIK